MLIDREAGGLDEEDVGATHVSKQWEVDLSIGETLHAVSPPEHRRAATSSHSALFAEPPKILKRLSSAILPVRLRSPRLHLYRRDGCGCGVHSVAELLIASMVSTSFCHSAETSSRLALVCFTSLRR